MDGTITALVVAEAMDGGAEADLARLILKLPVAVRALRPNACATQERT